MAKAGYVHERAVKMLVEAILGSYTRDWRRRPPGQTPVHVRCTPGGELSAVDIAEGVARVKVPDEWDSVGGIVPDLILYGEDDKPRRIIEVVNSSAPTKAKQEKLNVIARRGVEVVIIEVHTEEDLANMLERPNRPRFASLAGLPPIGSLQPQSVNLQASLLPHKQADVRVQELIGAILSCTPYQRQRLADVLSRIGTLDSIYPVPPTE